MSPGPLQLCTAPFCQMTLCYVLYLAAHVTSKWSGEQENLIHGLLSQLAIHAPIVILLDEFEQFICDSNEDAKSKLLGMWKKVLAGQAYNGVFIVAAMNVKYVNPVFQDKCVQIVYLLSKYTSC